MFGLIHCNLGNLFHQVMAKALTLFFNRFFCVIPDGLTDKDGPESGCQIGRYEKKLFSCLSVMISGNIDKSALKITQNMIERFILFGENQNTDVLIQYL